MKKEINQSVINEFESARRDYLRDLAELKAKYSLRFTQIVQGVSHEQVTAANH